MSYKITNGFRPREEMVQPLTATREIKIPSSVLPKLIGAQNIYNPALDSGQTNDGSAASVIQPEVNIGEQIISPEANPVNNVIQFPNIDVAALLSGNNAQKTEEPAVQIAQEINQTNLTDGEPAYGPTASNVIPFPTQNNESTVEEQAAQEAGELVALQRVQEAQELALAVTNQEIARLTAELAEKQEYKKVA